MPDDDPDTSVGEDDEESGDESPPRRSLSSFMKPRSSRPTTDGELREQMRTLDPRERRYAFILVPVGLLVTVLQLRAYTTSIKVEKPKNGSCAFLHGSSLVGKSCELPIVGHATDYKLIFVLGLVLCGVLLLGARRSMRTLVIFTAAFIGLFAGIPGILFLCYAGWLVWRSWQLQRHGTKDSAEYRKLSAERNAERAAERRERRSKKGSEEPTGRPQIQASKRYTPKSKAKRR
jgi:hypothetical protein